VRGVGKVRQVVKAGFRGAQKMRNKGKLSHVFTNQGLKKAG
jgi:hypothetical protein